MRIRTIKPALFTNAVVSSWPREARWTLAGLYCYLDDHGRGEDDPRLIVSAVYPRDDGMTAKKVDAHLGLMAAGQGPVCRYDSDDGTKLLHIVGWSDRGGDFYQQINRKTASQLDPCPKHDEVTLFDD